METDDPVFKLKLRFDICCMALEERRVTSHIYRTRSFIDLDVPKFEYIQEEW